MGFKWGFKSGICRKLWAKSKFSGNFVQLHFLSPLNSDIYCGQFDSHIPCHGSFHKEDYDLTSPASNEVNRFEGRQRPPFNFPMIYVLSLYLHLNNVF